MADRRSVWKDARVLAAAGDFVCAADEVWRLQRGSDADCVFFQRAVNGGKRITDGGTRQGSYVFAASGKLLARTNTRNAEQQLLTLEAGLAAWKALSESERKLPPDAALTPEHRWEDGYPADGLVLERIGRELGERGLDGPRAGAWNRDFAWFSASETRAMMRGRTAGERFEFPLLADRLARFHLVDNVRGQTLPFAAAEIELARVVGTVTDVHEAAGERLVHVHLEGETRAAADDVWRLGENLWTPSKAYPHGIACQLLGEAVWSEQRQKFVEFDLVAVGQRWGRTVMNGRGRDAAPGRVAFHLGLTDLRVAPTFIAVYDADWVPQPRVAPWRKSPAECGLEPQ